MMTDLTTVGVRTKGREQQGETSQRSGEWNLAAVRQKKRWPKVWMPK